MLSQFSLRGREPVEELHYLHSQPVLLCKAGQKVPHVTYTPQSRSVVDHVHIEQQRGFDSILKPVVHRLPESLNVPLPHLQYPLRAHLLEHLVQLQLDVFFEVIH